MQTAAAAKSAADSATSSLAYVDALISGATSQGRYSVYVEGTQLNPAGIVTLQSSGFTVTPKFDTMGTYPKYVITW